MLRFVMLGLSKASEHLKKKKIGRFGINRRLGVILLPFLYFDSGFVSKKMMMKWMVGRSSVSFWLSKANCSANFFFNDILLFVLPLFSWINRISLCLNISFSLALIFFLLHLWSLTHFLLVWVLKVKI